jgi:hypothetical protein
MQAWRVGGWRLRVCDPMCSDDVLPMIFSHGLPAYARKCARAHAHRHTHRMGWLDEGAWHRRMQRQASKGVKLGGHTHTHLHTCTHDMGSAPSGSRAWTTLRGSATVITADARDATKTACLASAIPPKDDLRWVRIARRQPRVKSRQGICALPNAWSGNWRSSLTTWW